MTILEAVAVLRRSGETVEPTGLGLYRVNGEIQRPNEVIEYAKELMNVKSLSR